MLDIKYIRDNIDLVKENIKKRRASADVDGLLKLDEGRREKLTHLEELRAKRNATSKGKPSKAEIAKMKKVGDEIKGLEKAVAILEEKYTDLLYAIPNITHPDVPEGGEKDFAVLKEWGEIPEFDFDAKDHEEILTELGLLDFERGAKVAGSKFYFTKGGLVRLNRALISYGIDKASEKGYELIETPDMALHDVLAGTGYNPRGDESQIYGIHGTDLGLIATAEVTVGGYHRDEVLDLSDGPKKYAAISHCFRREAGAYGRKSKGLYRVHQFSKLELFVFCEPKDSEKLHDELLALEEEIVQELKIPYRVIDTPSGDLGGPAYRKYDIEAWMPMFNDYGEITSASNCLEYQARRLNIKYKNGKKKEFVHTLNGTAIVSSRMPVAIVENFQKKDGTFEVPKALEKYYHG